MPREKEMSQTVGRLTTCFYVNRIVGLDLSLTNTGYCSVDSDGEVALFRSIPTSSKDGTRLERYLHIIRKLKTLITSHDVIFIEDYAFGIRKKNSQLATLGELNGIIKLALWKGSFFRLQPFLIGPGTWKKFLANDGKLKKDLFCAKVLKVWDIECANNDEAAAVAIAKTGYAAVFYGKHPLLKYQEKTIKDLRAKNNLHTCAEKA